MSQSPQSQPDLSIITSSYRSEAFWSSYTTHVTRTLQQVHAARLHVELVLIPNDATPAERAFIAGLQSALAAIATVRALHVPRETLYASWNRGFALSTAPILTCWNMDDIHSAESIIEGIRLLNDGYTLVDFAFRVIERVKRFGLFPATRERIHPAPFLQTPFTRYSALGPFSMMRRELYEQVGAFDANFRVVGDLEWASRARTIANAVIGTSIGGEFALYGGNLSSVGSAREDVECNIVFLRQGLWDEVRPTSDPQMMRDLWQSWGDTGVTIPGDVQNRLWGAEAAAAWNSLQREKTQLARERRLRALPRMLVDRLRLRPALAKIGLVQPEQ